jgi:AcrR family transcriptional regulator
MPAGRPRTFVADKALDRALKVFWRKGYEGASLDDLTAAMGINRPSMYAAFGNKESLFRKALDRYEEHAAGYVKNAFAEKTARRFVEQLLRGTADALSCPGQPRGCLIVQGALTCGEESDRVRRELIARRLSSEAAIRRRLKRAAAEGDLPRGMNPAELARFIATVIHGMSVQAASGATRGQLREIAATALRAWPD